MGQAFATSAQLLIVWASSVLVRFVNAPGRRKKYVWASALLLSLLLSLFFSGNIYAVWTFQQIVKNKKKKISGFLFCK